MDPRDILPQPPWEGPPIPRRLSSRGEPFTKYPPLRHDEILTLYHGTAGENLPSIESIGLKPLPSTRPEAMGIFRKEAGEVCSEYGITYDEVPQSIWREETDNYYRWVEEIEDLESGEEGPSVSMSFDLQGAAKETMAGRERKIGLYLAVSRYFRETKRAPTTGMKVFTLSKQVEGFILARQEQLGGCVVLTLRLRADQLSPECLSFQSKAWKEYNDTLRELASSEKRTKLLKERPEMVELDRMTREQLIVLSFDSFAYAPQVPLSCIVGVSQVPCRWS